MAFLNQSSRSRELSKVAGWLPCQGACSDSGLCELRWGHSSVAWLDIANEDKGSSTAPTSALNVRIPASARASLSLLRR